MTVPVPKDYTRSSFTEVTQTATFTIELTDPCLDTTLDSFTIDDVVIYALTDPQSRSIPLNTPDEVSRNYGS